MRLQWSALPNIIGTSHAMNEVKKIIDQVSQTDISVLILGESGIGKELLQWKMQKVSVLTRFRIILPS